MIEQFKSRVVAAAQSGTPLVLRGGGSKSFHGREPQGEELELAGHAGIVDYDPTELVVTARGGTPLAELEAALAARGQWLAFEPPHFGPGATVGGMVAAGLSGPGRASAGAVRDFLLGVKLMDGRGEVHDFGGRVMKNVAGYDVSRLMAGALGTLGILLEVSLKTLPRPPAEATLVFELPEARAIETLNRWGGQPLPLSASAWCDGELHLRLAGAAAAVRAAKAALGGDALPAEKAARFWRSVREQTHEFFSGDLPLWRLSLPATVQPLGLAGAQLIEWGGALRWLRSGADAAVIRDAARRAGGHATLFRGGERSGEVFQPLDPVLARIHRHLKAEFDPQGILNRGRLYADL